MIHLIVCMGKNREIGKDNDMPWGRGLPADLRYFKQVTTGHTVVMGRKTFESIGKPLPDRENIILTRDKNLQIDGCTVLHHLSDVLKLSEEKGKDVFIIGGAEIYAQFILFADTLYITKIKESFPADTYFPAYDPTNYTLTSYIKGKVDEKNHFPHGFYMYKKN